MRGCGVLMHITSLPGKGGVGSLGAEARQFVDFLAQSGQSWWQVLPLNPPAEGNSPYSAYSVFAGNPALISLDTLEQEGQLAFWTRQFMPKHTGERANFDVCRKVHLPMLRQAYQNSWDKVKDEVKAFRQRNIYWVDDYALFMTIRGMQENKPLQQWAEPMQTRRKPAMDQVMLRQLPEINFWIWVQYIFFKQWNALLEYARSKGVGIIGDMPLYPAMDSADVWAHPELFQMDGVDQPTAVAGVPPDDFTDDGQLWGNPLYDWEMLKNSGYAWWQERMGLMAKMYDAVRIDHFRGLDEYYAISPTAATAREGVWRKGPGLEFVNLLKNYVPGCKLIAEDLGVSSDSLKALLEQSGLPGMKVLQFAFDPDSDSPHLPHNFTQNTVGYTGTHDNDTVLGWAKSLGMAEETFARRYLGVGMRDNWLWAMIRALYATTADTVIVPIQDFLAMGSEGRMNTPGVAEGQWGFRVNGKQLSERLSVRMRECAQLYRRLPPDKTTS